TAQPEDDESFLNALRKSVASGGPKVGTATDELRENALLRWLESTAGTISVSGRLVRARPQPFGEAEGIVAQLQPTVGLAPEKCEAALSTALLAGTAARTADQRPLFGVRLHQFFSKGDTVYSSPEREQERYLTLQAQRFVPGTERTKILLPLCFCRECGQE